MKRGGFDCIIGNPPYGATLNAEEKAFFKSTYTCQSYQLDSYLLFLERTLSLLQAPTARSGFIIPNPWLTNLRQDATRRFVCGAASVAEIVHFTFPVFKSAVVDTQVVIFSTPLDDRNRVSIYKCEAVSFGRPLLTHVTDHVQREWIAKDGAVINIFLTPLERKLFSKIENSGKPIEQWFNINVGIKPYQVGKGVPPQDRRTVDERPFDSPTKRDKTYRPLLRGGDVQRFIIQQVEPRFISYGPWLAEPRPSAGFDAPHKILMRQTGDRPIAALDSGQRLAMNNLHVLVPRTESGPDVDLYYFLGILNSRLMTWYYRALNPEAGEALAEVKRENVAALPIRPLDLEDSTDRDKHTKMVSLVRKLVEIQEELAVSRNPQVRERLGILAEATDRKIDHLVYELYGLSSSEVETVEI